MGTPPRSPHRHEELISMPTTSYGYELTIGDHTDCDDIPVCCDNDMSGQDNDGGTALTIAPSGLVSDIAE